MWGRQNPAERGGRGGHRGGRGPPNYARQNPGYYDCGSDWNDYTGRGHYHAAQDRHGWDGRGGSTMRSGNTWYSENYDSRAKKNPEDIAQIIEETMKSKLEVMVKELFMSNSKMFTGEKTIINVDDDSDGKPMAEPRESDERLMEEGKEVEKKIVPIVEETGPAVNNNDALVSDIKQVIEGNLKVIANADEKNEETIVACDTIVASGETVPDKSNEVGNVTKSKELVSTKSNNETGMVAEFAKQESQQPKVAWGNVWPSSGLPVPQLPQSTGPQRWGSRSPQYPVDRSDWKGHRGFWSTEDVKKMEGKQVFVRYVPQKAEDGKPLEYTSTEEKALGRGLKRSHSIDNVVDGEAEKRTRMLNDDMNKSVVLNSCRELKQEIKKLRHLVCSCYCIKESILQLRSAVSRVEALDKQLREDTELKESNEYTAMRNMWIARAQLLQSAFDTTKLPDFELLDTLRWDRK